MGKPSTNRIKFNNPNLTAIEKKANSGQFDKESYLYDADSHLAIRIRPNQSFTESVFCIYERIRVHKQPKSRLIKRHIMKVGMARNADVSISELRKQADNRYLEIQQGNDPIEIAQIEAIKQVAELKTKEARRSFHEMIFGTPTAVEGEFSPNSFIAERRPSPRYLSDINTKCTVLLSDLLDTPLYEISADQIISVYLKRVGKGQTQLNNSMRIFRSVWNWAQAKYDESELFIRNPVSRAMRQLGININRTKCRKVRLDEIDLRPYVNAVLALRERDHSSGYRNGRDALLFMLFSGVRLSGTVAIRISDIDLTKGTFKIIKKGGDTAELPLNNVTKAIVTNRLSHLPDNCEYLFPGIAGRQHYRDTKTARSIVKEFSGIAVTNHDLRRTYKTIGSELDINHILVDELLCHVRSGVDAHYIHPSMERLREASQKIASHILNTSKIDISSQLVSQW